MLRKLKKYLLVSFLFLTIGSALFGHFYAPRFLTEIRNPLVQIVKSEQSEKIETRYDVNQPNVDCFSFKTFDDTNQSACLTKTKSDSLQGTIILIHGIRASKDHFIGLSNKLAEKGYNSISVDLRAHGQSEGQHCTFGVHEKRDIQNLINYLEKNDIETGNIGVWGQSLGASVALQAMAIDSRLKFGIIESTFSDFTTIANDYCQYHAGFSNKSLTNYMVARAGEIADFDPHDACTKKVCSKIINPVLMVHGDKDQRIDINYGKENFENIVSLEKEFLTIEGANHINVWEVGGDEYMEQVFGFIEKHN